MTLLDSVDSIIMLYSYTAFPEHSWKLFEKKTRTTNPEIAHETTNPEARPAPSTGKDDLKEVDPEKAPAEGDLVRETDPSTAVVMRAKTNVMSNLSIALTILSILLAFTSVAALFSNPKTSNPSSRISLITIISLIGENCSQCVAAAEAEDGGGLAGSWWRGWANVCPCFAKIPRNLLTRKRRARLLNNQGGSALV